MENKDSNLKQFARVGKIFPKLFITTTTDKLRHDNTSDSNLQSNQLNCDTKITI